MKGAQKTAEQAGDAKAAAEEAAMTDEEKAAAKAKEELEKKGMEIKSIEMK